MYKRQSELSPSSCVPKKNPDGSVAKNKFRLVGDFRQRNKRTKPQKYLIPRLDDIVHHLLGAAHFASFDQLKGYWQVLIDPNDAHLFAFSTPFGNYEYLRCPMGAINSGPHFQKCMQSVIEPLLYICVLQYVDDSLLYAATEADLLDALDKYFTCLARFNIKLHPSKAQFYT